MTTAAEMKKSGAYSEEEISKQKEIEAGGAISGGNVGKIRKEGDIPTEKPVKKEETKPMVSTPRPASAQEALDRVKKQEAEELIAKEEKAKEARTAAERDKTAKKEKEKPIFTKEVDKIKQRKDELDKIMKES